MTLPRGVLGRRPAVAVAAGLAVYLPVQVAVLWLLSLRAHAFFWIDDQQAQYLPVFHWLGQHLEGGRPPVLDPDLGASGNYLADPQYGVWDPVHWLVFAAVGRLEDLVLVSWLLSGSVVLAFGAGVVVLVRTLGAPVWLAGATALALASSGFFLWFGSSWFPLLWSTAWLPWLWVGLLLRGWPGIVVAGVATYLLASAGYPYHLVVAMVLVLVHVAVSRRTGVGTGPLLRTVLAVGAGGLAAAPALLAAQQLSPYTQRQSPVSAAGNVGALIPNLLDTLTGGATTTVSMSGTWGTSTLLFAPVVAGLVFALPAVALVDWSGALRFRGVAVGLAMLAAALVLTQLPTHVGPFRYPFRFLVPVVLFGSVTVVAALARSPRVTRPRVALAGGLVALQLAVALSRAPAVWTWHLLAATAAAGGTAAVLVWLTRDRRRLVVAAAACWVAVLLGLVAGVGSTTALARNVEDQVGLDRTGTPARQLPERLSWATSVQDYRNQVVAPDQVVTVPTWGSHGTAEGWDGGVLAGNANLLGDMRTGFGYIAAGQGEWTRRWCLDYLSAITVSDTCIDGLLERVPGTDVVWFDALSSNTLLLSTATPAAVRDHVERTWVDAGAVGVFERFVRAAPLPGRVTWVSPEVTAIESPTPPDGVVREDGVVERYRVTTGGTAEVLTRIPWWPGFTATLDGEPVDVTSAEGTAVVVRLPGGVVDGDLVLRYLPVGQQLVFPAIGAGALGIVVLAVLAHRAGGRPAAGRSVADD